MRQPDHLAASAERTSAQSDAIHRITAVRQATAEVERFVAEPVDEQFDELATRVVSLQAQWSEPYRRLVTSRAPEHSSFKNWREAPPVPTAAFKQVGFGLLPAETIFRSSGTTEGTSNRSQHHHGNLSLYRQIVEKTFPAAVLDGSTAPRPILSLIPPVSLVNDSSLGFMVDVLMRSFGDARSSYAFSNGALDTGSAWRWLFEHAEDTGGNGPLVLTTALALWELLRDGAAGPLASNVRVMETGGFKTRRGELDRVQLLEEFERKTQLSARHIVREYGMTELTSQAYAPHTGANHEDDLFELPPWVRVRALDPVNMVEHPEGTPGLLSFLDLGNVGSIAQVVTEDVGVVPQGAGGRRFQLLGRAEGAQLRGCSLTTEEMLPDRATEVRESRAP